MSDDIKENILSPAAWLRILFMVMYGFFCWLMGLIIICLIVIQAVFNLITGKNNENLASACSISVEYLYQILRFLSYCTDEKPFPFAPLPKVKKEAMESVEADVTENFYAEEAVEEEPLADTSEEPSTTTNEEQKPVSSESEDDVFADISFTTPDEDDDNKKKPEGTE